MRAYEDFPEIGGRSAPCPLSFCLGTLRGCRR